MLSDAQGTASGQEIDAIRKVDVAVGVRANVDGENCCKGQGRKVFAVPFVGPASFIWKVV